MRRETSSPPPLATLELVGIMGADESGDIMPRKSNAPRAGTKQGLPKEGRLTLRLDFEDIGRLGPGKVRLLELVEEHGSISAAGRAMGMSYRRAWQLIDELNRTFADELVKTQQGGVRGGGAVLTETGKSILNAYRAIERKAHKAAAAEIAVIARALAKP